VDAHSLPSPAFGQADLSNCEREQIHFAGSIQPHGALLLVRETDETVVQASANAAEFLKLDRVVGRTLGQLGGDLAARVRSQLGDSLHAIPLAVRCNAGGAGDAFDCLLHRPAGGGLVVELERAGPLVDLTAQVEGAMQRILAASSVEALSDETAQMFRELVGYDRVMVYRFDTHGHGEVLSERREPKFESYLGNWYPASDIPQMARRLYERNRVRVLVDVDCVPVPLTPRLSPFTGRDLDMSLCFLRTMSPIHMQYLQNMGVGATLVVSLVVRGRLWGLVACHHYAPRFVHYEVRAVCQLLAELVATRLAALESFVQAQAELGVRRIEQRMVEAISREGDWRAALFDGSELLMQMVGATGAALLFEGQTLTAGEVPATQQLREIAQWLDQRPPGPVFASDALARLAPEFAALMPAACGLLAARLSSQGGEYLIWFRPERIRTVTWGGDPRKAVVVGDDPTQLSPRRSFAQWHQLVEGTCEPWLPATLGAAKLIGDSVADVVLQFRAVRMLIAQDQLREVSGQVQGSEQAVLVADSDGRILVTNAAFDALFGHAQPHLQWLADLATLCVDPVPARLRLRELIEQRRSWRGELDLKTAGGDGRTLLARADPVFSVRDKALGFVVFLTDLASSRAAESARRSFQEGIIERHWSMSRPLDSDADLVYRRLLSLAVGNAQLAALEITDGVDLARMPEALESVRVSVTRTAELLEHILRHAAYVDRPKAP
jgi:light-regulated signal transduction histidine kinase (bacteriophytochrome)